MHARTRKHFIVNSSHYQLNFFISLYLYQVLQHPKQTRTVSSRRNSALHKFIIKLWTQKFIVSIWSVPDKCSPLEYRNRLPINSLKHYHSAVIYTRPSVPLNPAASYSSPSACPDSGCWTSTVATIPKTSSLSARFWSAYSTYRTTSYLNVSYSAYGPSDDFYSAA